MRGWRKDLEEVQGSGSDGRTLNVPYSPAASHLWAPVLGSHCGDSALSYSHGGEARGWTLEGERPPGRWEQALPGCVRKQSKEQVSGLTSPTLPEPEPKVQVPQAGPLDFQMGSCILYHRFYSIFI